MYLDYNATTPVDPRVFDAMKPFMTAHFGNPSSVHKYGRLSRTAIDVARNQVAELVGVDTSQVIFTSGGTEANNLAVTGVLAQRAKTALVHSSIEHSSVLEAMKVQEKNGWQRRVIAVDKQGLVDLQRLPDLLAEEALLVSVMAANNETGVIQDIARISDIAHQHGALMHTDAVQAAGKIAISFDEMKVDMMSVSAHKIYGPKGVGALIKAPRLAIDATLYGGGHENGLRAGTENLAGIVGFGAAAALAKNELDSRKAHFEKLTVYIEQQLASIAGVSIMSQQAKRVANTIMASIPGIEGETLLMQLDQKNIAVSSGSACSSKDTEPSHVLAAMGMAPELARRTIRISVGKETTMDEARLFMTTLKDILRIQH